MISTGNKVKIGVAGISFTSSFWGFTEPQYERRISQLNEVGKDLGATVVAAPKTFCDAEGAIDAAKRLNEAADFAVLDVATYPEGKAAIAFFDTLDLPLTLWARDECEYQTHIGHNSFCGANFLAGNLAIRGQRFRHLYGEPREPEFLARLRTALELIKAAKRASNSRIGLFGEGIVPKFYDIDIQSADRKTLEGRFGVVFVKIPTKELVRRANSYQGRDVEGEVHDFLRGYRAVEIPHEAVLKQVRLYRAIKEFCNEESLASVAVRCWPELQTLYGAWPCPSISVLNEAGIPAACEGDPGGALDMLLAHQMSDKPTTLVDIVDWSDEQNAFSVWHCGPTAYSWAHKNGAKLMPHNVDGRTPEGLPAKGLPGIVDMQFAPGPVTVFRTLGALDDEFVVQGELIDDPGRRICGSFGTVSKPTIYGREVGTRSIRTQILDRALPHHYTVARGHLFA